MVTEARKLKDACSLASLTAQLVKKSPSSIPGSGRSTGEGIGYPLQYSWASPVAQLVRNLPAMQETLVQYLGWDNPLKKGKATHSNILAWRILWSCKQSDTPERLSLSLLFGRKAMTNLDSILKSRDIPLPTKVHIVKAMVFFSSPVQTWELDHKEG